MTLDINHLDLSTINSGINELKKISVLKLRSICKPLKNSNYLINTEIIPSLGGVYCFWWTGDNDYFLKTINRVLLVAGPGKRIVKVEITDQWLELFNNKICLYVGKNSSNLKKRLSGHLRLGSQRDSSLSLDIFNEKSKTTTNQLKRGLEKLFINEPNIRELILDNVGLSYFVLSGDSNSVNRFYLEDKAIGEFYPILNVDIER